jgi:hypothetical protein
MELKGWRNVIGERCERLIPDLYDASGSV